MEENKIVFVKTASVGGDIAISVITNFGLEEKIIRYDSSSKELTWKMQLKEHLGKGFEILGPQSKKISVILEFTSTPPRITLFRDESGIPGIIGFAPASFTHEEECEIYKLTYEKILSYSDLK